LDYQLREWLNLAVRWAHVFAGIMWVGATFFFTWLDHTLRASEAEAPDGKGQVWMVHSGGFYIVEKQKGPQLLPQKLHWFKWEAMFTWITGLMLLTLVYYAGGLMVDDSVMKMSNAAAVGISVGALVIGWLLYDTLWISPLRKHELAGAVISYLLLLGAIYGFTHLFSGRAAFMQIGAMMGSFMALNVWVRILPAQRALIAAVQKHEEPNMSLAVIAKQRSKQNTFMVLPVVAIMISNHFPVATYGHSYNWAILGGLVLVGWGVAKVIR
jgi:uncharacterized membrane protein